MRTNADCLPAGVEIKERVPAFADEYAAEYAAARPCDAVFRLLYSSGSLSAGGPPFTVDNK
jgi:hypothetical protein